MWSNELGGRVGTERPHHVEWLKASHAAFNIIMEASKL